MKILLNLKSLNLLILFNTSFFTYSLTRIVSFLRCEIIMGFQNMFITENVFGLESLSEYYERIHNSYSKTDVFQQTQNLFISMDSVFIYIFPIDTSLGRTDNYFQILSLPVLSIYQGFYSYFVNRKILCATSKFDAKKINVLIRVNRKNNSFIFHKLSLCFNW